MDDATKFMIAKAIKDGDWTNVTVTRDQLMEYLIEASLTEKSITCPICTKNIKPYKVTLTHRSAKYLLSAVFLSKKSEDEGGDGYVYHEAIKNHAHGNWYYDKGKKKGSGIVYTSYSNLTQFPWDFLQPHTTTNDKLKRNGEFKPTIKCLKFLRGQVDVPEWILKMNREVIRYSHKNINILQMKDMNFHQAIELYKTFT